MSFEEIYLKENTLNCRRPRVTVSALIIADLKNQFLNFQKKQKYVFIQRKEYRREQKWMMFSGLY